MGYHIELIAIGMGGPVLGMQLGNVACCGLGSVLPLAWIKSIRYLRVPHPKFPNKRQSRKRHWHYRGSQLCLQRIDVALLFFYLFFRPDPSLDTDIGEGS